jgi:prepilin-type N-terminal cleavage/methylation domain-containing protein/prepilin-type processing-associated H-X9-DG protein
MSGWCKFRAIAGFSLLELLVVMTVISVLTALLLPGVQSARRKSRQVVCLGQLRQLGLGLAMYREEHDDIYPPANVPPINANYHQGLAPYLRTQTTNIGGFERLTNAYLCPEVWSRYGGTQPDLWGFAYNESISRDAFFWVPPIYPYQGVHPSYRVAPASALVPQPARKIAMTCNVNGNKWSYNLSSWDLWTQVDPWELKPPEGLHNGSDNYLYCDGHIEAHKPDRKDLVNSGWFANIKTSPYQY